MSRSLFVFITICGTTVAGPAAAHAFGDRYDLPLPLSFFLTGAAAVVALSFVVMGVFLRRAGTADAYPRFNLRSIAAGRWLSHPGFLESLRIVAVAAFLLTVVTGLFGSENPATNITTVMVWIIAWVGLAFVSALAGDFWALINPWNTIFRWAENMFAAGKMSPLLQVPAWLNAWPAAFLFWVFAWMEVAWDNAGVPFAVATALIVYSLITWVGMVMFGREEWLRRGEFFSVLFGLFARFSLTEVRDVDGKPEWNVRPFGVGLMVDRPPPVAVMVLAISVLAAVTFDGFTETQSWRDFALIVFDKVRHLGETGIVLIELIGVYGFPALFIAAYLVVILLIALLGQRLEDFGTLARRFVLSLIPIAIAYHLSHNLTQLFIEGQYVVAQVSDPFGYGWDLFGTATRQVDIGLIGAKAFWFFSVGAIVIGHVIAVYLAHREALVFFGDRNTALLSQFPMVVLMVGYTMISLWIIAQPVVI